jgi:hypothetical protein
VTKVDGILHHELFQYSRARRNGNHARPTSVNSIDFTDGAESSVRLPRLRCGERRQHTAGRVPGPPDSRTVTPSTRSLMNRRSSSIRSTSPCSARREEHGDLHPVR